MGQDTWTVAASTGTADEDSRKFLKFGRRPPAPKLAPIGGGPSPLSFTSSEQFGTEDSIVFLTHNAPKGHYSIRYHVPLEPIVNVERFQYMQVRYLVDDLDLNQVVVMLKKYSVVAPPGTEKAQIISAFDSNKHNPSPSFQLQHVDVEDQLKDGDYAYFIEVLLINNKEPFPLGIGIPIPGGELPSPAIAAIRLSNTAGADIILSEIK